MTLKTEKAELKSLPSEEDIADIISLYCSNDPDRQDFEYAATVVHKRITRGKR